MIQKYFNRFEIKYQISLRKRDDIIDHIQPFMKLDSYVENNFSYEVRSLYFDSPFRKAFFEKDNGVKLRSKLRIRYYPDYPQDEGDFAFIEIKKKINENVLKRRIMVPLQDSFKIIRNNSKEAKNFYKKAESQERATLKEIWFLYKTYHLRPVCVVCYNRQPYMSKFDRRFRLTFDTSVQIRNHNFDLKMGGGSKFVVPQQVCVLEVKFNSFIPNWAISVLQNHDLLQQKTSKFVDGLLKTRVFSLV